LAWRVVSLHTWIGKAFFIEAEIAPKTLASSGKSVGADKRQRCVSMRKRRNFLQVESNDLC